jgi:hypothetical protein
MAKRGTYRLDEYLQRKLNISQEQTSELMEQMKLDNIEKKNPSARILFPKGEKPTLSKFVES